MHYIIGISVVNVTVKKNNIQSVILTKLCYLLRINLSCQQKVCHRLLRTLALMGCPSLRVARSGYALRCGQLHRASTIIAHVATRQNIHTYSCARSYSFHARRVVVAAGGPLGRRCPWRHLIRDIENVLLGTLSPVFTPSHCLDAKVWFFQTVSWATLRHLLHVQRVHVDPF